MFNNMGKDIEGMESPVSYKQRYTVWGAGYACLQEYTMPGTRFSYGLAGLYSLYTSLRGCQTVGQHESGCIHWLSSHPERNRNPDLRNCG